MKPPKHPTVNRPAAAIAAAASIALALLAALPSSGASAHAGYESSTPPDGEVLAESPTEVEVFFSQEMARSEGLPSLIVVNASGDQVDLGSELDDTDRTRIVAPLAPSLPDGRYTVIWHTLSDEDGEEAQGAFHFFVGGEPSATGSASPTGAPESESATPAPTAPPSDDGDGDSGIPVLVTVGIGAIAAVGGLGLGIGIGRRRAA
jgi:methionine-rich copper-binding protein CopC